MFCLISITFIFIFKLNAQSQFEDDNFCGNDEVLTSGTVPVHTPETGKFFRVLIIYITFPDDTTSGPLTNIWPKPSGSPLQPSRPINPYQTDGRMIDTSEHSSATNFMTRYGEYTYSDFFCEMSQGAFDFIGDEVKVLLPNYASYYNSHNTSYSYLNTISIQKVDSQGVNFARYDNWNNSNGSYGSDGIVDFVVYHFRYVPGNDYNWFYGDPGVGGSTNPGVNITLQGKSINKGVWGIGNLYNTTRTQLVIEHEFIHFIQDISHPGRNPSHVSIGLETAGHGQSTYCMIPMERCASALNWDTSIYVDENNLQSSYILGDYISTGDVLKVKIPNTNPSEFFWISNHQKLSKYDGISRGSKTCTDINFFQQDPYCSEGKGIYIFHESADNCANNINGYDPNHGDVYFPFDLVNSEGKFDWVLDRTVSDPILGSFGIQKVVSGNRTSGVSEFNKLYLHSSWSGQLITDDPCSSNSNDYFITGDFHGDGLDAYNIGYEEIFSPYSNPSTVSCQNPSANTGLTIRLDSQISQTGEIILNIYYNDATALSDLPPSKPKNLKVIAEVVTDNVSFYPKLTWDNNIEPDFTSAYQNPTVPQTRYAVYKSISTSCTGEQTYSFLEEVDTNVYIDSSNLMYVSGSGPGPCSYYQVAASYKVSAIDNTDKESVKSERAVIKGYFDPCGAIGEDNISQNINSNEELSFNLYQNFPNPFNPVTIIMYDLPKDNNVTLKVYDILGKEVMTLVDEFKSAGRHTVNFDATSDADALPNGVYYYKIVAGEFSAVRRMLLIK